MRIIAKRNLREFWQREPESEQPLKSWYAEANAADWASPHEVKAMYRSASFVGNGRVVFNIAGNKFRLIVRFNFPYRIGYIRFVGTHAEYDTIDAETV
jgi:mRNA interferase HigB